MSTIDHKAEAVGFVVYSGDMNPEVTGERAMHALGLAQVHATLALVEQQKLANRIAWVHSHQSAGYGIRPDELEQIEAALS
ncbi:hypothetical protein FB562_2231 [Homoserinimonas aerilata]|uniref:Uncharacterized protein n=1 Tax=Homoserinimonas aerilata TaxID=1162970 RepID=A0A542YF61_9MICO|nr:hypothetical protein [Homoserinimonas aerilata]TQL46707.1 hypothetical protein FB562_2231 [Homoserinimonas aerilata]